MQCRWKHTGIVGAMTHLVYAACQCKRASHERTPASRDAMNKLSQAMLDTFPGEAREVPPPPEYPISCTASSSRWDSASGSMRSP